VRAHRDFGSASRSVLIQEDRSALDALGQFGKAVLAFPQPLVVLFAIVLGGTLLRAVRAGPMPDAVPVLGTLLATGIALHLLLIPVYGGVDFSERWMIAVMLPLPLLLFAALQPAPPGPGTLRAWLALLAALALAGLVARVVVQNRGGDECGRCRTQIPFTALADQLRDAGFRDGTILADGFHLAGNLRWPFPDARVVEGLGLIEVFGPPRAGACLIAWPEDAGPTMPDRLRDAAARLGVDLATAGAEGTARALIPGSQTRAYGVVWRLWPDGSGDCR
jgi:hypothetical protein